MSTGRSLLGVAVALAALAAPVRAADVRELRGVWITADTDVFASPASIADAMDFLCSTQAIEFCSAHKIVGMQIVLRFDEQHYDIVLPMLAERYSPQTRAFRTA